MPKSNAKKAYENSQKMKETDNLRNRIPLDSLEKQDSLQTAYNQQRAKFAKDLGATGLDVLSSIYGGVSKATQGGFNKFLQSLIKEGIKQSVDDSTYRAKIDSMRRK